MKVSAKEVFLAVGKAVRDMPIGDMRDVRGFFSDPFRSLMDMSVAEYSAVDFPHVVAAGFA